MIRSILISLIPAAALAQTLPADSARGELIFTSEHCVECHSVNGKGAHTAPDLGRSLDRDFTPAALVSTMWNHAPTMWTAIDARGVEVSHVDNQAAADLFAYFYSARFFEKPGDAGRGKQLFTNRRCSQCHGISSKINPAALPVSDWQHLGDPIELTAALWNHAAGMGTELLHQGLKLPALSGQDLTDLLVYLRNVPAQHSPLPSFRITSGLDGEKLFKNKGCIQCHPASGDSLANHLKGTALTGIAALMWDHGLRLPAATVHLEPAEMRELLSYQWAAQYFASSGDAIRGRRVFAAKQCGTCHDKAQNGAPPLVRGIPAFSEITMISALWRHGPAMLASMTQQNLPWPRFQAREMSDLIAYMNTRK